MSLRVNFHVALVRQTVLEAIHDLVDALFKEGPSLVDAASMRWRDAERGL